MGYFGIVLAKNSPVQFHSSRYFFLYFCFVFFFFIWALIFFSLSDDYSINLYVQINTFSLIVKCITNWVSGFLVGFLFCFLNLYTFSVLWIGMTFVSNILKVGSFFLCILPVFSCFSNTICTWSWHFSFLVRKSFVLYV